MHGVRPGRARELDLTARCEERTRESSGTGTAAATVRSADRGRAPRTVGSGGEYQAQPGKAPALGGRRYGSGALARSQFRLRRRAARPPVFADRSTRHMGRDREVLITADVGVTPARQNPSDSDPRSRSRGRGPQKNQIHAPAPNCRQGGGPRQPGAPHSAARGPPGASCSWSRQREGKTTQVRKARKVTGRRRETVVSARRTRSAPRRRPVQTWVSGSVADGPLGQGQGPGERSP